MMSEEEFLPMLSYVLKNGNVTVYQWKHGEAPVPNQNQNEPVPEEPSIDWGVGLDGPGIVAQDDGIDFGDIDFGEGILEGVGQEEVCLITLEESGVGGMVLEGEGQKGVAQQQERREYDGETE